MITTKSRYKAILGLGILGIVLVVLTSFLINHFYTTQQKLIRNSIETVKQTTEFSLISWREEVLFALDYWARSNEISEAAKSLNNPTDRQLKKLDDFMKPVLDAYHFRHYYIVDNNFKTVYSNNKYNLNNLNYLKKDSDAVSKLFFGKGTITAPVEMGGNLTSIFIVGNIQDDLGYVRGYLIFESDPSIHYAKIFEKGRIGESGETYAVNSEGKMASNSRFDDELKKLGLISNSQSSLLNIPIKHKKKLTLSAQKSLRKESGFNVDGYPDYRGVSVVGVWSWNDDFNIGIISEIDTAEAFASYYISRNIVILFGASAYCLFVLFVFMTMKKNKLLINERKELADLNLHLEDRVKEGVQEAQVANKAKSDFLAVMSHEIRTPMNAIIGYSELLGKANLGEEEREYANSIENSGKVLLGLINDILDFSKIESGEFDLVNDNFELTGLVNDIQDIFFHRISEKGLSFLINVDQEAKKKYYSDKNRIAQVLINLIGNSVKFTDQGSISLDITLNEHDEIYHFLSFKVTDTGVGIDEDSQKTLFSPFVQADSTSSRNFEGTGLGLTISKRIIEILGGKINFSTKLGEGTSFEFTIPLAVAQQESEIKNGKKLVALDKASSEDYKDCRILVVDDNKINLKLAKKKLEKAGFTHIEQAINGKDSLSKVETFRPNVILMDCMMPIMDGYDATKEIRRRGYSSEEILIVALTANALSDVKDKCIAAGMDEFMTKPYRFEDLNRILQAHFDKKSNKAA
ncbi:MAG: response regulator [Oligoflexia bacterium]|nr:response regulator [Oligoflexia bacterium]